MSNDKKRTVAKNGRGQSEIRWRIAVWVAAGIFLLANVIGNQVSTEVNWTLSDFISAGVLLFGSLGIYEIAARMTADTLYRAGVGVAIAGALLLTWSNAAVGLTDSAADLAYLGIPVVGIIGAFIARFQPEGMAHAMFAMAIAQALVGPVVLIAGMVPAHNSAFEIFGVTGLFVALFATSAWLFRQSAYGEADRASKAV